MSWFIYNLLKPVTRCWWKQFCFFCGDNVIRPPIRRPHIKIPVAKVKYGFRCFISRGIFPKISKNCLNSSLAWLGEQYTIDTNILLLFWTNFKSTASSKHGILTTLAESDSLFNSLLQEYPKSLEETMKGNGIVFDRIDLLHYKCRKISLNR